MCELLWGKKTNQSSIQNAHNKRVIEEDGWYCFRNAVAMMLLIFCLHPSISFAANPAKISAVTSDNITFNIPQQRADTALTQFAEQANLTLVFPFEDVKEKTANRLVGDYPITQAAQLLLENTGLTPTFSNQLVLNIEIEAKGKRNMKTQINQRKSLLATFVAVFGAGAVSSGVMAQDGDDAATGQRQLDEIIVTAQKREQNIMDVPIAIAALGGEELEARGIENLEDLSFAVPGLLVADSGSISRRISIRGIGNVFGSSSLVGLYIDDASVAALSGQQLDVRAYDLQRIEVLKGPQGTLYGEGSVGGTVRFITEDPSLDDVGGRLDLDTSFTKGGDPSYSLKGAIDIPIIQDELALRIVGQYVNDGGWIDQPERSKEDINESNLTNLRAKLLWQPNDELQLKAMVITHRNEMDGQTMGVDENSDYYQAAFSGDDLLLLDNPVLPSTTTPATDDDYDLYNLTVSYDLGAATLLSSTSYLDVDTQTRNYSYQCCFAGNTVGGLWDVYAPERNAEAQVMTQEVRLSANDDSVWYWSAGVFYRDAEAIPESFPTPALFGVPGGTSGTDLFPFTSHGEENSQSWAVFGEVSRQLSDQLEVGVGIRYYEDDREFRSSTTGPFQQDTFDSVNPKLFASYAINDDINLYANIAKGFRSGGFNGAGEPPFEPEEVISYEVGSKAVLLDGALSAEIALYQSSYEDYQIVGVIPQLGLNITSNAGEATIQGIDLSLAWRLHEDFELGFNGNYLDTEFDTINATTTSHNVGDPLDLVPRHGFTLWSKLDFIWFDSSEGFARIDYNQQGKSYYRNRSFSDDYVSTSDVVDLMNARIGWVQDQWSVELYAENILDDNGYTAPFVIEKTAARSQPRTFGLSLAINFD